MNIGRVGSDPPGAAQDLTMSKSGRDSLHGDGRMDAADLSRPEMGTIVHLLLQSKGYERPIATARWRQWRHDRVSASIRSPLDNAK